VNQLTSVDSLLNMRMHEDVMLLNANVFSNWESDFSCRPNTGVFNFMKVASGQNVCMEHEQDFLQVQQWPHSRAHGSFFVILERSHGTVVMSTDHTKVYLTQGIFSSIGKLLRDCGHKLPTYALAATFLPFRGYVAFDGLVIGAAWEMADGMKKMFYRAYCKAVDEGTLITSLPLISTPPHPVDPSATPALSTSQACMLQRLRALPKHSDKTKGVHWVFRRFGYSELGNPGHLIAIVGSDGRPVVNRFATLRSLRPTALEIFDLLCYTLFGGCIGIGERSPALIVQRHLLENLSSLQTAPTRALAPS
jgi:hypothetical protein